MKKKTSILIIFAILLLNSVLSSRDVYKCDESSCETKGSYYCTIVTPNCSYLCPWEYKDYDLN